MAKHKKRKTLQVSTKLSKVAHQNPHKLSKKATSKPAPHSTPDHKKAPDIPFDPASDRILLVGEGDFSFARCLVEHHGCCDVTATCLDSQAELFAKYEPQAEENTAFLEADGAGVVFRADATTLAANKELRKLRAAGGLWDRIVFNFPHVGGRSTDVNRQVRFNQELLVDFFRSSVPLLSPDGGATVAVTLFEGEPYTLWNIRDLARHCGLAVERSFRFEARAYPGYRHARTLGNLDGGGGWKGEEREARTFILGRKGDSDEVKRKRKRGDEEDDED